MKKKKLKILNWLKKNGKEHLGNALEMIGENTSIPIVSALLDGIGEKLQNDKTLTPEQLKEVNDLIKLDVQSVTTRWESDNKQELKLPKLIRPIVLGYTWLLLTVLIVLYAFGVDIDSTYLDIFEILALTVNGAYFGARTVEKYHKQKYNEKN